MIRLTDNSLNIKNNYKSLNMDFIFDSINEGNTHAGVYTNNLEDPSVSIVCEGHSIYFGGLSNDIDEYKKAIKFFKSKILTEEKRSRLGVLKIIYSSEIWEQVLGDSLGDFNTNVYDRVLLKNNFENITSQTLDDSEIKILEINRKLLEKQLVNTGSVVDEIIYMWGSVKQFIDNGFGYCAVKGDAIIGWCTSEYMSKNACGIGIETAKEFQGQGVASKLAECVVTKCSELNLVPHWDSWKKNIPSVRVAEKSGFKKVLDYKIIFIRF